MSEENSNENLLKSAPETVEQLVREITPEAYEGLKTAVELGKWGDGSRLTNEQLENCMQAIILYESEHLEENDRTGALLNSGCQSKQAH